jgi:hypothetical protein
MLIKEFPFHKNPQLDELRTSWASFKRMFKKQELEPIRLYFGEKMAFYFDWL